METMKNRIQNARYLVAQLNTYVKGQSRQGRNAATLAQPKAQRNLTVYRVDGSIKRSHAEEVARLATK